MSTEDQNRAVVTLHKGVDTEEFVNQMMDAGYELHDEKPGSKRNFDFVMTQEQAAELRKDPRIVDVRYGSKIENGYHLINASLDEITRAYEKGNTLAPDQGNWGLLSCTSGADPYGGISGTVPYNFPYTLSGQDIDVVIQDTGIQPDHPEFISDADGATVRYQQVDWPSISGLSATYIQPAQYHRDIDGHGTHVAGIAVGRRFGWARNANIYSLKILDDPGNTFGTSASFNMLRAWHNSKKASNPQDDSVPIRPTIVNMSWGYFAVYENIVGGEYRGALWSGTTMQGQYGMIQGQQYEGEWTHPIRVASVDADIQDCLDDGIIMVAAAGNGSHKCDVPGGQDYDNFWTSSVYGTTYYHRGSTPMAQPGVISVGNISYVYQSGQEPLFNSSEKGPRVDISAPGGPIMSSIATGSTKALANGTSAHPDNASWEISKLSGTSMASPQVAGVLACLLEARPHYTQAQCLRWLQEVSESNRLYDPTTGIPSTDYNNKRALQGAANLYLKTPFVGTQPYNVS